MICPKCGAEAEDICEQCECEDLVSKQAWDAAQSVVEGAA